MKYFLHDTNAMNDEKVYELYMQYGYEGVGLFYAALEKIAQQEQPIKTDVLKRQLRVGRRLEKIWLFMESLGILSTKNGETFNENILKFSEKYQIKKQNTKIRVAKFREKQADVTCYDRVSNARKDNISKDNIKESTLDDKSSAPPPKNKEANKVSRPLVESFAEWLGGAPDGDYRLNNLFPARYLAKKIWADVGDGGDVDNDVVIKQFRGILNRMDDFHKKNATTIAYINKHYQKITNTLK